MSNPSGKKGHAGEMFFLRRLRKLFYPDLVAEDREDDWEHPLQLSTLKGVHDYGDYIGVPWLHEAKSTAAPHFQEWARICERKAGTEWVIMWHGDLRKKGSGPYCVMPWSMYEGLARAFQQS